MPLPFALGLGLVLGAFLALAAGPSLRRTDGGRVRVHTLAVAGLFGALVLGPATSYFVAFHGDWAHLYLVPAARVPSAVDLALLLGISTAPAAVVALAAQPMAWPYAGRPDASRIVAGVTVVAALMALFVARRRILVVGTYGQYHGAFGLVPLGESRVGLASLLLGGLVVGGAVLAWRDVAEHGRER